MNVRDQIVSYLAGELGAAESTALRARLREDEQARAEYDALAELVYGASQHEPPLAMQARVFEAVEAALDGAVDAAHAPAAAERKQRWRWLGVPMPAAGSSRSRGRCRRRSC